MAIGCWHERFAIDRDDRHSETGEYGAMCLVCGQKLWIAACMGCEDPQCERASTEEHGGWTLKRNPISTDG